MKKDLQPGDHLVSLRLGYSHHGLYVGNGTVIHYAGPNKGGQRAAVESVALEDFAPGAMAYTRPHPIRHFSRAQAVARARRRIGERHYNLAFNNCEHFVNWCINGVHLSRQVNHVLAAPVAALSVASKLASTTYLASTVASGTLGKTTAAAAGGKVATTAVGKASAGFVSAGVLSKTTATTAAGAVGTGAAGSGLATVGGTAGLVAASSPLAPALAIGALTAAGTFGLWSLLQKRRR